MKKKLIDQLRFVSIAMICFAVAVSLYDIYGLSHSIYIGIFLLDYFFLHL